MLGIAILSGQFGPGELFDGEIAASQSFAVSRSAYREAVRILAAKGLIEARPRAGTRVTPKAQWNLLDPDILLWAFAAEPDPVLLERLFELRSVVESTAAGFAAKRRSAAQLKAMWAALERMAMHTLATEAGREADLAVHATLLEATHNPFIISLSSGISAAIYSTTLFKQQREPPRRNPMPEHLRVVEAIAASAPGRAKRAMSELIELACADTLAALRGRRRNNGRVRSL